MVIRWIAKLAIYNSNYLVTGFWIPPLIFADMSSNLKIWRSWGYTILCVFRQKKPKKKKKNIMQKKIAKKREEMSGHYS